MIYELRCYDIEPGRMADQYHRFDVLLPSLFQRHRIQCVGSWRADAGANGSRFIYLVAFDDFAHRESSWAGFYADELWWSVRAESNAGSELVERHDIFFLRPNPMFRSAAIVTPTGPHELIIQQISAGLSADANGFLREIWLPFMERAGAHTMGVFDVASGCGLPAVAIFLAWPDGATRDVAWRSMEADHFIKQRLAEQRQLAGRTVIGRRNVTLLQSRPSAPPSSSLGRGIRG